MNRGVFWFLILAFAGAWIPWEVALRIGIPVGSVWFQLAVLPTGFAPAVSAFVIRKWVTREGFADAGLVLNLRKWPYYVVALLLPLVVLFFIALEARAGSLATPDISALVALKTIPILLLAAIVATPVLWGEEFGWRGYLQQRLFPERPVWAAVGTGLIWAVWHYPLILRGFDYPQHPLTGAAIFPIGTVLISIIFGWLMKKTGSVWASSLGHAATNVVGGRLGQLLFGMGGDAVIVGYLGVLAFVPLALIAAWIILTGQLSKPMAPSLT